MNGMRIIKDVEKMSNELIKNIDKVHTTNLEICRLKKNLHLENDDVVSYCKKLILDSKILQKGKNWYCEIDDIIITINIYSYTIITAHLKGSKK